MDNPPDFPEAPASPPGPEPPPALLRRRAATLATLGGLGLGGLIGGYVVSHAATTVATATPAPSPSGGSDGTPQYGGPGGMHGGMHADVPGGRDEDLQVAASAIGISLSDLQAALQKGQSIAAVAKAHNVAASKVISALVTSEDKEIDSAQSAGGITSAQATKLKSGVQQRVTDMVNGTGGAGCHGGMGGPGPGFGGPRGTGGSGAPVPGGGSA